MPLRPAPVSGLGGGANRLSAPSAGLTGLTPDVPLPGGEMGHPRDSAAGMAIPLSHFPVGERGALVPST